MMTSTKSAKAGIDMGWNLLVLFAVVLGVSIIPTGAFAASNVIEQVFCNLVYLMNGTTGKAIATIAIIAVGAGALLGKISWGMALIVAIGIALIFGAASIVTALGGTSDACASGSLTTL